jgi:hypothetical protein
MPGVQGEEFKHGATRQAKVDDRSGQKINPHRYAGN